VNADSGVFADPFFQIATAVGVRPPQRGAPDAAVRLLHRAQYAPGEAARSFAVRLKSLIRLTLLNRECVNAKLNRDRTRRYRLRPVPGLREQMRQGRNYPSRMESPRPWNGNIHYHPLLVNAIPKGTMSVLDVGCGDGMLAADLVRSGVPEVVALDIDADVLTRAKSRHTGLPIRWVHGDLFAAAPGGNRLFDAVVTVASLHHFDARAGLLRFSELVRPGGVVAVVGRAANDWWDWPLEVLPHCARLGAKMMGRYWEHSAPTVWPPPLTYRQVRQVASIVLPGVKYRRHFFSRYSLVWLRPE